MVIKNHESGLTLPPAPEFGPDGLWPPVETEWLPLRWELFELETQELEAMIAWMLFNTASRSISDDAWLKGFYTKPSFGKSSVELSLSKDKASIRIAFGGNASEVSVSRTTLFGLAALDLSDLRSIALKTFRAKELRQLIHCVRWRRKDPVIQLPPDASHELTHTVTTGLSIEQSQTLTESLGLDLGGNSAGLQAKLSYKLQEQFGLKLSITATEEISTKLTLRGLCKTLVIASRRVAVRNRTAS